MFFGVRYIDFRSDQYSHSVFSLAPGTGKDKESSFELKHLSAGLVCLELLTLYGDGLMSGRNPDADLLPLGVICGKLSSL